LEYKKVFCRKQLMKTKYRASKSEWKSQLKQMVSLMLKLKQQLFLSNGP